MIKFGIIGTNWITQQFIDAAKATNQWQLVGVYSRTMAKAEEFGIKNGATKFFEDIEKMVQDDDIQVVYIASPNSLHCKQAKQVIEADKIAIVEKPVVSNPMEFEQLNQLLKQHPKARLLEAARHIHEPNFQAIQNQLKQMPLIQGANLTYAKYSSRYDAFLSGKTPNVFSLDFAGGALQDLGVYVVYDAVSWFGMPEEVAYFPIKLRTRVDGHGVAILRYPEFDVTLNIGKNINSHLPSEIYGLKDTIVMDNAAELQKVDYFDSEGQDHLISTTPDANPMTAEVKAFTQIIINPDSDESLRKYHEWFDLSRNVNKLLYNLRQNGKIYFTNEKNEEE